MQTARCTRRDTTAPYVLRLAGATGAVLRFTHAEEIEPLAVLLGLPGSTKQASLSEPYSYLPSCKPITKGSYFYDLNELKRCYNEA